MTDGTGLISPEGDEGFGAKVEVDAQHRNDPDLQSTSNGSALKWLKTS